MFILKAMADPHSKGGKGGTLFDGFGGTKSGGDFRVLQGETAKGKTFEQAQKTARAAQTRANNQRRKARQAREAQRG